MGIYDDALRDSEYIRRLRSKGSELADSLTAEPPADVGIFTEFEAWEAGRTYEKQYSLFTYNGRIGFTRQPNITAQEIYPPFSTGTESLYGVRPIVDINGVFPYVYNMAASAGMRISEGERVYECTQAIDPLLYPPSELPAHFTEV